MSNNIYLPPNATHENSPHHVVYQSRSSRAPVNHVSDSRLNQELHPHQAEHDRFGQEAHLTTTDSSLENASVRLEIAEGARRLEALREGYIPEDEMSRNDSVVAQPSDESDKTECSPDLPAGQWIQPELFEAADHHVQEEPRSPLERAYEEPRPQPERLYEEPRWEPHRTFYPPYPSHVRHTEHLHYHSAPFFSNTRIRGNIFVIGNVQDGLEAFRMAMRPDDGGYGYEEEQPYYADSTGAENDTRSMPESEAAGTQDMGEGNKVRESESPAIDSADHTLFEDHDGSFDEEQQQSEHNDHIEQEEQQPQNRMHLKVEEDEQE